MRTNPTHTIPSLSGTFGIPTRLALNPKMPKEPSSPSRPNTRTERCIKCGIDKGINKGQLVTRNIRKPGSVGILNVCTFIKNCNGLTSLSSEIPASAYCQPLCAIKDNLEAIDE